jgi:hypothetical protein
MKTHVIYLICSTLVGISGCIKEQATSEINVLNRDASMVSQDRSIQSDLNFLDLETSDLETSDLETSDLETSDLETSDLETSDLDPPEEMTCIPYDDQCSESQYCQYETDRLHCVDNGSVPFDQTGNNPECSQGRCSRGMICLNADLVPNSFGDQPRCYQPCAPEFVNQVGAQCSDEVGCCLTGRHTCFPLNTSEDILLGFGVCKY